MNTGLTLEGFGFFFVLGVFLLIGIFFGIQTLIVFIKSKIEKNK